MTETTSTTRAVRAGIETDSQYGAVMPPLYLSTNYSFEGLGRQRRYDYARGGNPTRDCLAQALAELEGGVGAVVTSSGMAAVTLALQLLPLGARVLVAHDCYGGTWRLLEAWARRGTIELEFADLTDAQVLAQALDRQPDLVWVETPSNPLLRITDIEAVAGAAHAAGALCLVDNTFLSPALQQPLRLGADLVLHSTTKYINGHSDVVGGALVTATQELQDKLAWWSNCTGIGGAPFDSYLTLRGLRTLSARLRVHQENADILAERLQAHPGVHRVHYPGLACHPQHTLAARQQAGFGAMLSFELVGGEPAVQAFVEKLRCFSLAESLGGVESLIAHPASMTHAAMAPQARRRAGIADSLLRISAGIESADDLVEDIENALSPARTYAHATSRVSP